jgi:predicted transcriptional regulator
VDGIVGGTALFAIAYSILNAVQNKRLNSRVLSFIREQAVPISEQEISRLLNIPLARLQQRIDSLFSSGLIEQVTGPHWQDRAQRAWRPRDQSTVSPGG